MNSTDQLQKIEDAYLNVVLARSNLRVSGPFVISLTSATKLRWLNNALVRDRAHQITRNDVDAMVQVFEANDRMPRMELIRSLNVDLIDLLLEAGFEIESEMPLMIADPESFKPQISESIAVEILTPASDPTPFMRVADQAFDHNEPITPERIEGMRQNLRRGSQWSALATIRGEPAAVASLVVGDSTAELAGVGTLEEYRRQGAASTASTRLLQEFFEQNGELAWLSAGDDIAQMVYERMGFEIAGKQTNISKPNHHED